MTVFLSYPHEQLESAVEVDGFLSSLDVGIWFDRKSLIGGQDWEHERRQAEKQADLVVLLCSRETAHRGGVIQREVKDALEFQKDKPIGHVFLVPVRTEDVSLPEEFMAFHQIDMFQSGWRGKLANSVKFRIEQLGKEVPIRLQQFIEESSLSTESQARHIADLVGKSELRADYIIYQKDGSYWEYINSAVRTEVFNRFYSVRNKMKEYHKMDDEQERSKSWSLTLDEYFRSSELVSLKISEFIDYGGPHPSRGFRGRNFGGEEIGEVVLEELFSRDDTLFNYLKQYVELDVKRQILGSSETNYSLSEFINSEHPWNIFSQWNFSDKGLRLYLSEFSGLPFVMGVFEVLVPWGQLISKLAESYRGTALGQLIAENAQSAG